MAPYYSSWTDCTAADVAFVYDSTTATSFNVFKIEASNTQQWIRENESHKERSRRLRSHMRNMVRIPTPKPLKWSSVFRKPVLILCLRHKTALSLSQRRKEKRRKWIKALKEL